MKEKYPSVSEATEKERISMVKEIFGAVTGRYDFLNHFLYAQSFPQLIFEIGGLYAERKLDPALIKIPRRTFHFLIGQNYITLLYL